MDLYALSMSKNKPLCNKKHDIIVNKWLQPMRLEDRTRGNLILLLSLMGRIVSTAAFKSYTAGTFQYIVEKAGCYGKYMLYRMEERNYGCPS